MPSDVAAAARAAKPSPADGPEAKGGRLWVRLFLIPLLIVFMAVGLMYLIGSLVGQAPSLDEALRGLQQQGGQRTMGVLLGPGSKQRYVYAKAVIDHMKQGMTEPERVRVSESVVQTLDQHTSPEEGEIRHLLLLALGRAWQVSPGQGADTSASEAARLRAAEALLRYSADVDHRTQTAAVLATAYWAGRPESRQFTTRLGQLLADPSVDFDVRLSAATALGPIGKFDRLTATTMLRQSLGTTDPRDVELVWASALSLAQLGDETAVEVLLPLLDRDSLSRLLVYDREADVGSPSRRPLNDQEKLRFLINVMEGGKVLGSEAFRAKVRQLADTDPSDRVRYTAKEIVSGWDNPAVHP